MREDKGNYFRCRRGANEPDLSVPLTNASPVASSGAALDGWCVVGSRRHDISTRFTCRQAWRPRAFVDFVIFFKLGVAARVANKFDFFRRSQLYRNPLFTKRERNYIDFNVGFKLFRI